jgi:hypothetical protein
MVRNSQQNSVLSIDVCGRFARLNSGQDARGAFSNDFQFMTVMKFSIMEDSNEDKEEK